MIIKSFFILLLLLFYSPSTTGAEEFASKVDTIYDCMHKPLLIKSKDQITITYKLYKSNDIISRNISYKEGKEKLEEAIRLAYYKKVSDECIAMAIPFVIVFNSKLRPKGVFMLYCPPFVEYSDILNFIKRFVKKTKGKWITSDKESQGYFYVARLMLI